MSVLTDQRDESSWHQWRSERITATDVADAATGSYGGAYGVLARKLGLQVVEENEFMRRGTAWQPAIADAVHALTGSYVVGEEAWCTHREHDWCSATVDGFLAPMPEATPDDLEAVLEVKTRALHVRPNRDRWYSQIQWQCFVTGLPRAVLAEAAIDDADDTCHSLRLEVIEADEFAQDVLFDVATDLYAHLQAGTLPEPDTASALPIVKAVHAGADPDAETVDLTDLADDLARFAAIKTAVKAVTDERDELEARIRDRIGEATKGSAPGFRVSLSIPARTFTAAAEVEVLAAHPEMGKTVLDRDRLKAELPDVYDAARTPVGARRLTVSEETR